MQSPSPAILCAENIALLYLLHSVPTLPAANAVSHLQHGRPGYVLPFDREEGLASTLAFLVNTKVDTNHIPALCIKETPTSLDILLALNKTTWDDGREIMRGLQRVFDTLFAILSDDSIVAPHCEDRIFTAIISMCSPRILCRLRLKAKGAQKLKQPIKAVLEEAIHGVRRLSNAQLGDHVQVARLFIERSKSVMGLADAWFKHQTLAELQQLVEGVYDMSQIERLQPLVNAIPNQDMCPSSRRNLINMVGKVSRYREAARYLYRTAKKYKIVRRMKIVPVNLPKGSFSRNSTTNCDSNLTSTIRRITGGHRKPEINHLCSLLSVSKQQLYDQFAKQTQKTLKESKIHAEVQLVYYCEISSFDTPPRVICSSKDACFLCNAFITMHGKMYTPRQHGRLYPAWRLPPGPISSDLELRFATVLERQVQSSLETLLVRRRKTEYPDPNESTLLALFLSTSTLRTAVVSTEATQVFRIPQRRSEEQISPSNDRLDSRIHLPTASASSPCKFGCATQQSQIKTPEVDLQESFSPAISVPSHTQSSSPHHTETPPPSTASQTLTQGKAIISTPGTDIYIAGPLKLYLDRTTPNSSPPSGSTATSHIYSLEWLTETEAKHSTVAQEVNVIDVDALRGEASYELHVQHVVVLAARGVTVRITQSS